MTMSNAISGRYGGPTAGAGPLAAHVHAHSHRRAHEQPVSSRLTRGLGWFSIGLGLSQLFVPRRIARVIGVPDDTKNCALMRLLGLRELASGVGTLSSRRPGGWIWARAAGDVMDLALLGSALASDDTEKDRLAAATLAVIGVTAADIYEAVRLGGPSGSLASSYAWGPGEVHVRKAITVNRTVEEVYAFWRDLRNLPRFMLHLQSVEEIGDGRTRWRTRAPAGMSVEWEAETIEDKLNDRIAWKSLEGSQVDNAGSVRFVKAPGGRGTEVHVELRYSPTAGAMGAAIAWLFGESADQQIYDDLRAFKQVIETGEVIVSEGSLGHRGHYWQRPAQPPAELPADWPALED